MICFILNDEKITTDLNPGTTVLDFVRESRHLKGTKIGCREGDCGACMVIVGCLSKDQMTYNIMTSCLMPLANAHGKHIVTIEGLNLDGLTPVQKAMVDNNGTQCGFCTVGFVVSLSSFVLSDKADYDSAICSIDGNICRCTGYKSIEKAVRSITSGLVDKPHKSKLQWLVENQFIPEYFTNIDSRLESITKNQKAILYIGEDEHLVGGGTDLYVQKQEQIKSMKTKFIYNQSTLKDIVEKGGKCYIGAAVSVTDMIESPLIRSIFPEFPKYMKLVSSTPIRNMATLAGNLINASPIGDMTIFFLALDASVVLIRNGRSRTIKLKDLYMGYKQLAKESSEFVKEIFFKIPTGTFHFNFEKVSKRTHLDIASVNSACSLITDENGMIMEAHLSAGGVAPVPKYLSATSDYLVGKSISEENFINALKISQSEISPISDARGSKSYKRQLLRQLLICHFYKFFYAKIGIQKLLYLEG